MSHTPTTGIDAHTWAAVLSELTAAGATDARNAAAWWQQDAVGGRASGDVTAVGARVLAGIDAGDPAVLDARADAADEDHIAATYTEHAPTGAPAWDQLTAAHRADADAADRDGFDTTLTDEIAHPCAVAMRAASATPANAVAGGAP